MSTDLPLAAAYGRETWMLTVRGETALLGRYQLVVNEIGGAVAGRVTCSRPITVGLTLSLDCPIAPRPTRLRIVPIPLRTVGGLRIYPIEGYTNE